jgi:hypothetical protein
MEESFKNLSIKDNIVDGNLEKKIYIIQKKPKSVKKIKSKSSGNNVNQIKSDASAVLTSCPLPESFNKDILEEEIKKYMKPREEYYKSKNRSPYVEDEFSEYFTAMASGGCEIGGGHCGMDVKTKNDEGIDAMCVIMNKDISNEKSIIQMFLINKFN